jgi:hypothetical protein
VSTFADRQRAYRQRCRRGRAVFHVELDQVACEELLIGASLLLAEQRDDREAIELALARLLELLIAESEAGFDHAGVSR